MEAQGRSAQQEPTQNLGETLTVPFTPTQQSQLHLLFSPSSPTDGSHRGEFG